VTSKPPSLRTPDKARMHAWVNERLDIRDIAGETTEEESPLYRIKLLAALPRAVVDKIGAVRAAKSRWHHGDVGPLRKLYPEVAEAFAPPARWRQRRLRRDQTDKRLLQVLARKDVILIRKLFVEEYGQWRGASPSAEEIAADRHGLTMAEVREAMKRGR
jgi:hypothetical protein